MTHYDTSAYRYAGVEDPYACDGCPPVEQFNGYEVEDFVGADSILGLGNKKKQAERKLKRAERKIAKGKTRAAERLQNKAGKILSRIQDKQGMQVQLAGQLAAVNAGNDQAAMALRSANESLYPQTQPDAPAPMPLSVQPMSNTGSSSSPSMGGGGSIDYGSISDTSTLTGVESEAPNTSPNDEPTGELAKIKELPGVSVKSGKKGSVALIIIGVVVIVFAVIYFSKRKK